MTETKTPEVIAAEAATALVAQKAIEAQKAVDAAKVEQKVAPVKEIDQSAVKKNAAYFARNPEEFDAVLAELETAGHVKIKQDVANLQRELTVRDAISDHGLTRADAVFIQGTTPEEINASAAAFKARVGDTKTEASPEEAEAAAALAKAKEAAAKLPALPQAQGALSTHDQAEADLIEAAGPWCSTFDTNNLGRK